MAAPPTLSPSLTLRRAVHQLQVLSVYGSMEDTPLLPSPRRRIWVYTSRLIPLAGLAASLWGLVFCLTPTDATPPSGQLFQLGVMGVTAQLAGCVMTKLHLPPLLGMLAVGLLMGNTGVVAFTGTYVAVQGVIRSAALMLILTRAGLGLDPTALRRLGPAVARLAVLPSLMELTSAALVSRSLLAMPWEWCFLLGSVLAAVSPAVVVPLLLSLQTDGYGVGSGLTTVILAAATCDDVIGVAAFRILLAIIFYSDSLFNTIAEGPLCVIYGVCYGAAWGGFVGLFPAASDPHASLVRTLLLVTGSMVCMVGSDVIGYDGAGPLGSVVAAFVAARVGDMGSTSEHVALLWTIFQPLLFALVGAQVDVHVLGWRDVSTGVAVVAVGVVSRLLVSVVAAVGSDFTWRERVFVAIAWFPKATVQAAVAPVALDLVVRTGRQEDAPYAHAVLVTGTLAILLTAPLGAVLITLLGPRLLARGVRGQGEGARGLLEVSVGNEGDGTVKGSRNGYTIEGTDDREREGMMVY